MQIVDYDEATNHLHVRVAGRDRVHGGVPAWLVDRLRAAEDPVTFYRDNIRGADGVGRYPLIAHGATLDEV